MTIRDFLKNSTIVEGYLKIQCWEGNENYPTVYTEGYSVDLKGIMDKEIMYIFPYNNGTEPCICIEIENDD